MRRRRVPHRARLVLAVVLACLPLGCGFGGGDGSSDAITVYTCVNEESIQPIIDEFEGADSGREVKLFRAPTGDLNARVAGDIRSGGLAADVIWACDPLTMQNYVDQDLVGGWLPEGSDAIPENFRTDDYVGVAVLYVVAIHHDDEPEPAAWSDLTQAEYAPVAVPDPTVAASALGAVGYFDQAPGYGLEFYATLRDQGGEQVSTPDDVVAGVAQGLYPAGITIATSAYLARDSGSPIGVVWPEPGAVAVYGPIALATDSADSSLAQDFITYVVSEPGQQTLAEAGSYPTRPGVTGPEVPPGAPIVYPDWATIGVGQDTLLEDYGQIFGG